VRLVLASKSARRAAMLRDAGFAVDQVAPPFDDPPDPTAHDPTAGDPTAQGQAHLAPGDLAADLARRKALSVAGHDDAWLIAADTLCVDADGLLLGTPTDPAEARAMLDRFRDAAHQVITGVCLRPPQAGAERSEAADRTPLTLHDTATVRWGDVPPHELDRYAAGTEWHGKAGGYNLFDRQAAGWPITVEGDPTTVVGLPMRRLLRVLDRLGIRPAVAATP